MVTSNLTTGRRSGRRGRIVAVALRVAVAGLATTGIVTAAVLPGIDAPAAQADADAGDGDTPFGVQAVTDGALLESVEAARTPSTRVAVQVDADDTDAARAAIWSLGGTVTGSLAGSYVQGWVPAARVDELPGLGAFTRITSPRVVNRPVSASSVAGAGGRVETASDPARDPSTIVNADAWHAAGITGTVKVGIIDFFNLRLWNTAVHGPKPQTSNGHVFCRDTSAPSQGYCPVPGDGDHLPGVNNGDGQEHGVAVAEVVHDVAPGAELYLATVATTDDLRAAIDWFAANGVGIVTRSLGAPYDGPGDGTGPLDDVVDHAADMGIVWFNSAGNDGDGGYGRYTDGITADGYVDFDNGPGVDTELRIAGEPCVGFDGIRWSTDWGKPADQVTDYEVEVASFGGSFSTIRSTVGNQANGEPPLELDDAYECGSFRFRIRTSTHTGAHGQPPDVIEVGLFTGQIEPGRSQAAYSASKPGVDSDNPALVSVGAIDPAAGAVVAAYSSQGPTNDGRLKPDVTAPSCLASTIYQPDVYGAGACFNGTSAASPVAAGVAALLSSRGLAAGPAPLAALSRHLVVDLGAPGADLAYGTGKVLLPAPPPATVDTRASTFQPLGTAQRIIDTRATSPTPGAPIGPFAAGAIVDVAIPPQATAVTAVAVSIVSVDSVAANYVQALPTLMGQLGAFANLNVATPGQVKPNFAIVPVGANGAISVYLPTGGNVVVDLMGYFAPATTPGPAAGRFIATSPGRVLDTRSGARPAAGSTTTIPLAGVVPDDAVAVVLNVTATEAASPGYLRVQAAGAPSGGTANGNYVPGQDSGTMTIVQRGAGGNVEVYTFGSTHIVADITGYITGPSSPAGTAGLFVPITPGRAYDSRAGSATIHAAGTTRDVQIAGQLGIPAGATGVSVNFAADAAQSLGFLTAYPADGDLPVVSNLNFPATSPISNAGMVRLSPTGGLKIFVNRTTHVIIDANGYFTGTT